MRGKKENRIHATRKYLVNGIVFDHCLCPFTHKNTMLASIENFTVFYNSIAPLTYRSSINCTFENKFRFSSRSPSHSPPPPCCFYARYIYTCSPSQRSQFSGVSHIAEHAVIDLHGSSTQGGDAVTCKYHAIVHHTHSRNITFLNPSRSDKNH
jgi:hypothetical protein